MCKDCGSHAYEPMNDHPEQEPGVTSATCAQCGGALTFGPKGLTCSQCDVPKEMVVKKVMFGFRLISAKNVFTEKEVFSAQQLEELHQKGITITVQY